MKNTNHVVMHDGTGPNPYQFKCLLCGETFQPQVPISIKMLLAIAKAFQRDHKNCKQREVKVSELIKSKTVTTRKPHVCFGCLRKIARGNVMYVSAYTDGGEAYTIRTCELCEAITLHISDGDELSEGYVIDEMQYCEVNTPAELLAYLEGGK